MQNEHIIRALAELSTAAEIGYSAENMWYSKKQSTPGSCRSSWKR